MATRGRTGCTWIVRGVELKAAKGQYDRPGLGQLVVLLQVAAMTCGGVMVGVERIKCCVDRVR